MQANARDHYLETQILTATPQKLRLLLIEGALRFGQRTLHLWEQDKPEEAYEALLRCRGIVVELLGAVKRDESELTRQVFALYTFLFQTLTLAQMERDRERLEQVLDILAEERETWRMVCEQMPDAPEREEPREITASDAAPSNESSEPSADEPSAGFDSQSCDIPAAPSASSPAKHESFSFDA